MKLYKLTDGEGRTGHSYVDTLWGEGVSHAAVGEHAELYTDGVIHAYTSPLIAVFMDSAYTGMLRAGGLLWEAEGDVVVADGTKVGCRSLTTVKQIAIPEIPPERRVEAAIRVAKLVYDNAEWNEWADRWLDGSDRANANSALNASARASFIAVVAANASAACHAAASSAAAAYYAAVGDVFAVANTAPFAACYVTTYAEPAEIEHALLSALKEDDHE